MNKLILYTLLLLFLINGKINSQENVLKNIIKSSKSMKTDVGKQISRAKSHEKAGLINELKPVLYVLRVDLDRAISLAFVPY